MDKEEDEKDAADDASNEDRHDIDKSEYMSSDPDDLGNPKI